jgi:hypothetical protein
MRNKAGSDHCACTRHLKTLNIARIDDMTKLETTNIIDSRHQPPTDFEEVLAQASDPMAT